MTEIKINNTSYTVNQNETILSVAQREGIHIPTMCWVKEFKPSTSCMVCVVQDMRNGKILTSCSAKAEQGMVIETDNEEVIDMRKSALELLLSEHYGDCEAPCQRVCPAEMDIPYMNRLIADGKMDEALQNISETIALPSILGYICPAPCEKACRRKDIDEPVSICLLKRFVGENEDDKTIKSPKNNIPVAIIGAGPAGLAASYYFAKNGFECHVYDNNDLPGGKMRTDIPEERLPREVLDFEIKRIEKLGVKFYQNQPIDADKIKTDLSKKYSFILLTIGAETSIDTSIFNKTSYSNIKELDIYTLNNTHIFAPKQIPSKSKMAVRAAALGRKMCEWTMEFIGNQEISGPARTFNSVYKRIAEVERDEFLKEALNHSGQEKTADYLTGFTAVQAVKEAQRCLHCDCRKKDDCDLRSLSTEYKASQRVYTLDKHKNTVKNTEHKQIILENLKCIKCGICIQTTQRSGDKTGFAFSGRGFDVQIAIPLDKSITELSEKTSIKCAKNCPTGAIALK
ncbi:MAG TPA: 2Fe-2S iron-sulfur cluster-binding protein [Paludibacter sp.]|nr:2Fe-2S iron-sulfur cluster-binding protein [Paludibacter sp.]